MDREICSDMMFEILSRTSLKTLDAFRCTSKEFENLTYDSNLLNLHTQRNNIVSGYLVQNSRSVFEHQFTPSPGSRNLDLKFMPPKSRILASSEQGMVVLESPHLKTYGLVVYHVCKPSTNQIRTIPNPKTRYLTEKVAIVVISSQPLRYKIVRLSVPAERVLLRRDGRYTNYRCELFDSQKWVWRELDLILLPLDVFLVNEQPISAQGSVYFLFTNNKIMKFDAFSEKWTTFSLPTPILDDRRPYIYTTKLLVKYEGKLAFACDKSPNENNWELWVISNNQQWEKKFSFNEEAVIGGRTMLEAFQNSNTCVMKDYDALIYYKFDKDSYIIDKVQLENEHFYQFFPLRSDFEPTNLNKIQSLVYDI